MLSVAEIINLAREESGTTTNEISDARCLSYINIDYPKILNKIYFMDKNYGQTKRQTDIIGGQNIYSLLEPIQIGSPGGPLFGQQDIEKVMVKLADDLGEYYECRIVDFDNFTKDLVIYETTQPKQSPFLIFGDRRITIYPKPDIDVINGLVFYGTKKPYKLTLSSTYIDILIPEQYQDILIWALIPRLYRARKLPNDVNQATMEYNQKEQELLYHISVKQTTPSEGIVNDYNYLS